jgi:pteridine reductase
VTGSGKHRVGWHVAAALAQRGYSIAIHYRSSAEEAAASVAQLQQRGVPALAVQADVSNEPDVKRIISQVLDQFGRIDVLATCAAIWQPKRLEDVTAEDVRRHFEINALGTFLCAQHAGLAMVRQPSGGAIVTIGDWAEARPYLGYSAYFASKGAVSTLTRSLAVELAARNPLVRVNCILPGPVMLPADLSEAERRRSIAGTLVQREGRPEHVAQAVLALVENDFITGVCLPVDGGRTLHSPDESPSLD